MSVDGLRIGVPGVSWPMETFVERLLVGLAGRGAEVVLASRHRPSSLWMQTTGIGWRYAGPRPDRESVAAQRHTNGVVDAGRALAAFARAQGQGWAQALRSVDVIYAPWLSILVNRPQLFELGPPVVTSCRGSLVTIAPWDPGRPGYRAELRAVFDRSAAVHCVSRDILVESIALGLDPDKAQVIHPAVDPARFTPGPLRGVDAAVRVVAVGSLIWRKDYEHAITALAKAVSEGEDIVLDIIGGGPLDEQLRYTTEDLGLGERVRLRGQLPSSSVAEALARADVFLHTSTGEGVSNAVLEAMATGLPIVTTDAGGMAEAVRHEVDGLVVPVRGVDDMVAALVRLARDPDERRRFGRAARQRVESSFTLDSQVERFHALLGRAAAEDGGR